MLDFGGIQYVAPSDSIWPRISWATYALSPNTTLPVSVTFDSNSTATVPSLILPGVSNSLTGLPNASTSA